MSKVIFIGSKLSNTKNNVPMMAKSLLQYNKKHEVEVIYFEDLLFEITNQKQFIGDIKGKDIASADLVIMCNWYKNGEKRYYRDLAYTISLYLEKHHVSFWNSETITQRSTTKLSTMMQLALHDLTIPATYFSLNSNYLKKIAIQKLKTPFIMKGIATSRGRVNYLIKNHKDVNKILEEEDNTQGLIVQEYISNEEDYRLVCVNYRPVLAIRRRRLDQNSHLNNTSTGAEANIVELHKLPRGILTKVEKACKIMKRQLGGVDILIPVTGSVKIIFLEINPIPQLTSGAFIDQKLKLLARNIDQFLKGAEA